jgi:hypothetical protein
MKKHTGFSYILPAMKGEENKNPIKRAQVALGHL